jgi:Tol biopolymer transport system component
MTLASGTKLGPYEIIEPLGAGGMGEVYRAKDTRLDRTVAIKVLPPQFSSDPTRKMRFEREAKTVSTLNHPNICSLFDVGSQDGVEFLVMECIEGESLAKRLERGAMPVDQVLRFGAELAAAIGTAHRGGVIHRDIKPGNVMLTKSGAKLLDFGLARPAAAAASLATMTATSASPSPVTEQGTIVGTFQYMSPEQVEGKELDARSDIFSLGAVLYEMVTGERAFQGKSQLSVASAILEKEVPPIRNLKPLTPPSLEHVIGRCLAKDPDDRWQTGRDLAGELKWISDSGTNMSGTAAAVHMQTVPARAGKGAWGWVAAGVLAAILLVGAVFSRTQRTVEEPKYFFAPLSFSARGMAIAPNGHTVAIVGYKTEERKNLVWLYEVGGREAKSVAGTEDANFPFWSPDGKSLGFFADGKLKRVDIAGGAAQTLADAPTGRGGTWNQNGEILFTPSGEMGVVLNLISATGGAAKPVSVLDPKRNETSHRWPMFLPDGKHYLYLAFDVADRAGADAIYAAELGTGEKHFVVRAVSNAAFAEPGFLFFYRDGALFSQHFDLKSLELSGTPQPVLADVQLLPRIGRASFAVSNDGLLVVQSGAAASLSRLIWYDRKGNEQGSVGAPDVYANVELSHDGKSVAVDKTDLENQNADVWIYNLHGEGAKRMTFNPAIDATPVWSPDSTQILFSSGRKPTFDLYLKDVNGAQEEKAANDDPTGDKYPTSWSRDGKTILFTEGGQLRLMSYPGMNSRDFFKGTASVKSGQFSPDGKWVAYSSNESGRWEIYVTSYPDAKGKWQVSNQGGTQPRWRGDSKELFFLAPDAMMMAVPVSGGATFNFGAPVALFQATPREMVATSEMIAYDVTNDGQKFLINTDVKTGNAQPMSVILNWDAELKNK